jgi:hypothetical protein
MHIEGLTAAGIARKPFPFGSNAQPLRVETA